MDPTFIVGRANLAVSASQSSAFEPYDPEQHYYGNYRKPPSPDEPAADPAERTNYVQERKYIELIDLTRDYHQHFDAPTPAPSRYSPSSDESYYQACNSNNSTDLFTVRANEKERWAVENLLHDMRTKRSRTDEHPKINSGGSTPEYSPPGSPLHRSPDNSAHVSRPGPSCVLDTVAHSQYHFTDEVGPVMYVDTDHQVHLSAERKVKSVEPLSSASRVKPQPDPDRSQN